MLGGSFFNPLSNIKKHLNVKAEWVIIDNWIYVLHRKLSFIVALSCLLIATSQFLFVEDDTLIVCLGSARDTIPDKFWGQWCYLSGTYINPEYISKKIGVDVPHPGIGPDDPSKDPLRLIYYMFYPIIFLTQSFTFRASKYIWKQLEGGRLKSLLSELDTIYAIKVPNDRMEEEINKRIKSMASYMANSPLNFHKSYSIKFILCEVYNGLNIIFQFCMIDVMLNGEFFNFGVDAVAFIQNLSSQNDNSLSSEIIVDPFTKIFPKVAKCSLTKAGPSGSPVTYEALCILPWNNVAEKIFLIWWFWLAILGIITGLGLVYRFVVVMSPSARHWVLRMKTKRSGCDDVKLKEYCFEARYGDWFVLSMVEKNLDPWVFASLLEELSNQRKELIARKDH